MATSEERVSRINLDSVADISHPFAHEYNTITPQHPCTLTPLHPCTLAPEYFPLQKVKRSFFLITFSGAPKFCENLRKSLNAEKIESYIDAKTSYTHMMLHTHKQMRVTTIYNIITRHNAAMLSDKQRIILRNPSEFEESIMFFSRKEGESMQDCAFYRRIQQAKDHSVIGHYHSWPSTAQEIEECRINKQEQCKALRIGSPRRPAPAPAPETQAKKGGRQKRVATILPSPRACKTRRAAAAELLEARELPEARPVVLSVEPIQVNDPRYGEIVARCAAQERRLRETERLLQELQESLKQSDMRERLERVENVVEAGSVVQEAERQRMAKEFGDRLGELEEKTNTLDGESADYSERIFYFERIQERDEGRLESAEMSITEATDRFDKLEEAREETEVRIKRLEESREESEVRIKRLEEARVASEARLEGAMALSSASAARDEASKTREDANARRLGELENSLAERLSNIEERLSWGMLSAVREGSEQLRQELTERIARAEAAAAGQQDVRGVVGEALRVFHETHLLSKADVNALAQRVLQLEAAGRAETDALRARATELERENAALKAVGRACERERAERSEQMDFLIRNGMMPSISGGPGRELGP